MVALANLLGDQENHPSLSIGDSTFLVNQIVRCFQATLAGRSYPTGSNTYFKAWRLGIGIANLCKSDANKLALVEAGLIRLLGEGLAQEEHELTLRMLESLWHLSFIEPAQLQIKEDEDLMALIRELSASEDSVIRKSARGILWNLGDRTKASESAMQKESARGAQGESKATKHIMLSYCWANQPIVVQLANDLKAAGFSVWLDIDQMAGSTLEAMADAVENSCVVLCAISDAYKNSAACRVEGEYAYTLKKPVIPILVEADYRASGWLGALLGTKLWYDVSTPDLLTASLPKLMPELEKAAAEAKTDGSGTSAMTTPTIAPPASVGAVASVAPDVKQTSTSMTATSATTVDKVGSMTIDEVGEWLRDNDLSDCVAPLADAKFDGFALVGLYETSLGMGKPELLYSVLKQDLGLAAGVAFKFAFKLRRLCC